MSKIGKSALCLCLALMLTVAAGAQAVNGTLTAAQPASMQILPGEVFAFEYVLEQTSRVTLEAISGTAQPVIRIQRDGAVVASQPNEAGQFGVELSAILSAGRYIVEVAGANDTSGLVILSVRGQTPLPVVNLTSGTAAAGTVTVSEPVVVFEFGQIAEPSFLLVDTFLPDRGIDVRLVNLGTGASVGSSSAEIVGVRFQLAAGSAAYQLQVGAAGTQSDTPYVVCLTFLRVGGCQGGVQAAATQEAGAPTVEATAPVTSACTVTPSASGGVNIRQSATVNSIVLGALPTGANANVLGTSPDGSFFNIELSGVVGWVSAGVVTASGDCASLPTVQPPAPIVPTATPTPTHTPVPPSPTPAGPCLITITAPTFVYTTTIAQVDYLYDQMQSGELVPVGRTADGNWYRTNYANSWLPAQAIGQTASRSGDCSNLPIVSP